MIISMDLNLNASPLPEEDDEDVFDGHAQESALEERAESAVETMRREREERRQRMKREYPDESPKTKTVFKSQKRDPVVQNRNFRSYDKSKLPPGWLECPSVGKPILDLLVPSKVPLGDDFNDCVIPGKRYSLRHVIQQRARELGLVIDLTNTTRYYNVADWKKQGIKHFKIACKGRDSVPDNQSVNKFVWEVFQFKARRKQLKKYVLVHCTHGHNRTGYMIVHYLVRFERFSVTEAIQVFAQARPPGIYKQDYIDALYTFYHERKPESITCPPTPEWKRSSDLDLNGEAPPDEDDDGAAAPLHKDHVAAEVMTNDDILGDIIPDDQQEAMRQICYQFLKMGTGVKGTSQFPGSHPVSLNRDNLQTLRTRYYYATWKADGTRYMMLITNDGCYLIDRNFCFRRVQMRFPLRQTNEKQANEAGTHNFTLLDGEMVIDTLPDTHKQERRYLIYDLMAINHTSVVERPFCERWKMLEKEVIEPRNLERQFIHLSKVPYYRYEMEPFRVRRKDFWLLSTVNKLLKEFIPRLSHEADGLIFQGWDDPYVTRTHEGLLKWKYPEMNSVDFLFEVTEDNNELLFLYERGRKKLMEGRNKVEFRDGSEPLAYSGKIIECSWDSIEEVWIFLRVRTDKSTPNDFNTYRKVMRSIKDNITEEVLLNEIVEIIRLPMYADRIRNDSKARMHHHSGHRR